jgi:murein DD-endopeptidase MepM/ murein hydrolase activator NlpD
LPQDAVVRPRRAIEDVWNVGSGRAGAERVSAARRRWRRCAAALGLAAAGAIAVAAPAAAQTGTGGAAPVAPEQAPAEQRLVRAPAPTANLYGTPAPRIKRFACRSACAAGGLARPGSLVRVTGRGLRRVDEVLFLGTDVEAADDASVAPRRATRRSLVARVPRTAVTGRLAVARADGTRSPATAVPLTVEPLPPALPAGVIDAEAQGHKVFFGAQRPAELSYVIGGTNTTEVQVELVRGADGAAIASWAPGVVEPGVPQTVQWDGTAAGKVQRDGVYQFRVTATDAAGGRAVSAQEPAAPVDADAPGAFNFLGYRFPVAGAHDFGDFAASFGGGRGHQGHDVFAKCGTPIVAARGGVVQFKQYHSRAGYYLVIDGDRTGVDFVYMHLREAALVDKDERVKTGQLIGFVGDSGRAHGCHLHFEEWTSPGWYTGGKPFDPLPDLRVWDAQS